MLTDQREQELKKELAATAKENAVLSVVTGAGIKLTKPIRSYVESALSVEIREGSPVITATEPTTGRAYASLDAFIEAVKGDPDFQPATSQSSSGGNSAQPRQVRVEDLAEHLDKRRVPLEDVASGNVRVVFPEPATRELQANEVSAHSQKQLNSSIEKIASGETRVVFPGHA